MYSAPYSFDMHSNWLGLAITTPNVQLDADKMYYGTYSYVALEEFYNSVRPAKICSHGKICNNFVRPALASGTDNEGGVKPSVN